MNLSLHGRGEGGGGAFGGSLALSSQFLRPSLSVFSGSTPKMPYSPGTENNQMPGIGLGRGGGGDEEGWN